MSNYTGIDLVKLRTMYSQNEIIQYFDVDEEDKQYLKKIERILNYMRNCYCYYTDPTNGSICMNEIFHDLQQIILKENEVS